MRPPLPIMIAGAAFNIEPAAIRIPVQRRAGTLNRVDLAYLWPSLVPPDPSIKIVDGAPVDPNERLFATIQASDGTMPINERVQTHLSALPRPRDSAARRRADAAAVPRRHALSRRGDGL